MAFDEGLAERVRLVLEDLPVIERKMFGGVTFMWRGHMATGIIKDELVIRTSAEDYPKALAEPFARVFDFTGRVMKGWVVIAAEGLDEPEALESWIKRSLAFIGSLPEK